MKKIFFSSVFFILALGFVAPLRAEDLGAVKARMEQRLAQVKTLKSQGAVGENNRGFLDVRGSGGDAGAVVAAENSDREVVYASLAKQTGTSAEQVGKARARKLAQGANPGEWIQDESGQWKKK